MNYIARSSVPPDSGYIVHPLSPTFLIGWRTEWIKPPRPRTFRITALSLAETIANSAPRQAIGLPSCQVPGLKGEIGTGWPPLGAAILDISYRLAHRVFDIADAAVLVRRPLRLH